MSYTPNTWAAGDTITAQKLNNMEQGIANAVDVFLVTFTLNEDETSATADKTYDEVLAAANAGKVVAGLIPNKGWMSFYNDDGWLTFECNYIYSDLIYCVVTMEDADTISVDLTAFTITPKAEG